MSKPKYYVTAPVYDPAFEPSIGSLYTAILCDAIARHKRMCGFDVAHFAGAETYQISAEYSKERSGVGRANLLGPKEREFDDLLGLVEVHGDHFCRSGSAQHVLALQTMAQHQALPASHL